MGKQEQSIVKTDTERILDKVKGEIKTAKLFEEKYKGSNSGAYFEGKVKALADIKTWIEEIIL